MVIPFDIHYKRYKRGKDRYSGSNCGSISGSGCGRTCSGSDRSSRTEDSRPLFVTAFISRHRLFVSECLPFASPLLRFGYTTVKLQGMLERKNRASLMSEGRDDDSREGNE